MAHEVVETVREMPTSPFTQDEKDRSPGKFTGTSGSRQFEAILRGRYSMWIFGYGSLMWDGWQDAFGCVRHETAVLRDFQRTFNKASVKNWGTQDDPGPTLNLESSEGASCVGIAFEFPEQHAAAVLEYLGKREGKGFELREALLELAGNNVVAAKVPIYAGKNIISRETPEEIATLVLGARGSSGRCRDYVSSIAEKLQALGIQDPAVSELWALIRAEP
jgi:cation transport protein ChaC